MAMSSATVRDSGCIQSSGHSGMTISTLTAPQRNGHLWVLLLVTTSKIYLKTSSHFYVFVLVDGRLMGCGRRITTARSSPHQIGRVRRQCLILVTLMMAASTSARCLWIPWMSRQMNYLMCLDQRNQRQG